jgi:hypothetical protein
MQALLLMGIYVLTTITMQFIGFLISQLVNVKIPTISVMVFLICFMAAFAIAWPIAVQITEAIIRSSGRAVEKADMRAT